MDPFSVPSSPEKWWECDLPLSDSPDFSETPMESICLSPALSSSPLTLHLSDTTTSTLMGGQLGRHVRISPKDLFLRAKATSTPSKKASIAEEQAWVSLMRDLFPDLSDPVSDPTESINDSQPLSHKKNLNYNTDKKAFLEGPTDPINSPTAEKRKLLSELKARLTAAEKAMESLKVSLKKLIEHKL